MKPWLWLSPAMAHRLSPLALNALSGVIGGQPEQWRPFAWRGLNFPNRLGIAGGVDKDAVNVRAWWRMGAGFLEVGTITPKPQPGNSAPVVDRDVPHRAVWNRLGFPSQGLQRIKPRLEQLPRPFSTPIFANIGKNATTPLDEAHQDYIQLIEELHGLVDGFVVNISSPNTQGLRELLRPERLKAFLEPLLKARREPILLKLSPDMTDAELESALDTSLELNLDGWVLTNTSQGLRENLPFPKDGGVSGAPLKERSRKLLAKAVQHLGSRRGDRLLISVGGVMSADDVLERLHLGADLVQIYAALIFSGPFFFREVAKCQQLRA